MPPIFLLCLQPAADIILSPPPVEPRALALHSTDEQHHKQKVAEGIASQLAGVKLDLRATTEVEGVAASSSKPIWMPSLGQASHSTIHSRSKVRATWSCGQILHLSAFLFIFFTRHLPV